jgi:cytochrome c553
MRMLKNRALVVILGVAVAASSTAVRSQQPPPVPTDKPWAFPLKPDRTLPEDPAAKTLPGSTKTYTMEQIDDLLNPPDWFPDQHPAPPQIVVKGHAGAMACGACHLMSGLGHPESSDLTGLTADYIIQQMMDFKTGERRDPTRMNGIAKETSDQEAREAAEYFAKLPRRPFQKVVEASTVPKTFLGNGRMRFAEPDGSTEPIGSRIITVPEDIDRARLRDPYSGFVSYVPPGSLARGKELVETGGGGRTLRCGSCHGADLKGVGNAPRLAGMHPIYTFRQLYWFKDGSRNGIGAALMKNSVAQLTEDDMIAISAYLGSLAP